MGVAGSGIGHGRTFCAYKFFGGTGVLAGNSIFMGGTRDTYFIFGIICFNNGAVHMLIVRVTRLTIVSLAGNGSTSLRNCLCDAIRT
jgi:hypothetical protein